MENYAWHIVASISAGDWLFVAVASTVFVLLVSVPICLISYHFEYKKFLRDNQETENNDND